MSRRSEFQRYNQLLLGVIGVLSIAVFVIDIYIPLGVSGSMIYILFVMATYWKDKYVTVWAGAIGTLLIIAGYMFSVTTEYLILSGVNHLLAIIVMWTSVWFVNNYKASLQEIKKNYRVLFQTANDEILVFQLDKKNQPKPFLEINDTACTILGYSREELLHKTLYEISASEKDVLNRRMDDAIKHGEILYESKHITKNGDLIPLELSVRSFTYNGRQAIISVGRDLRERRRLEQEILQASEQERQRIGRDMHDDLGQLLTVATLSARMLGQEMETQEIPEAKQVQEIADMIKAAGERSRIISHGLVPVNVEVNGLDDAFRELSSTMSTIYDIQIHYVGNEDIQITNNSIAVHVYRIAQEAINNAVKHGNATSIEFELSSSANNITLRIKDNGIGFSDTKAMTEGIGLRIMNFRANMIGGNLKISSEKGKGTEIICQFPGNQ